MPKSQVPPKDGDKAPRPLILPVRLINSSAISSLQEVEDFVVICDSESSDSSTLPGESMGKKNDGDKNWPEPLMTLYSQSTNELNDMQQSQLDELLGKRVDLFAKSPTDLGHCSLVQQEIQTGDARPIKQSCAYNQGGLVTLFLLWISTVWCAIQSCFHAAGLRLKQMSQFGASIRLTVDKASHEQSGLFHELARKHMRAATERQKSDYDTRASMRRYKVGDFVDFVNKNKRIGKSPKLEPNKCFGPCVVLKVYSDLHYAVQQGPKSKIRVLHHGNLKRNFSGIASEWVKSQQEKLESADAEPKQTSPLCTEDLPRRQQVAIGTGADEVTRCTDAGFDPVQGKSGQTPTVHASHSTQQGSAAKATDHSPCHGSKSTDNLGQTQQQPDGHINPGNDLRRSPRVGRPPDRFGCAVNSDCSITL